jgi:class 3 adenylate cyclase
MALEPALRNDLIELLAANFNPNEVNELGILILGSFDSNKVSGMKNHISLSSRKSAKLLVDRCELGGQLPALLKLVVEVDDSVMHGRSVRVDGLETFLGKLLKAGIVYDFKTRRIINSCNDPGDLVNWGCLKEGREYETAIISLDIANNSTLVRKHGLRKMERLYFTLWGFLRDKLAVTDGRIWSWAGDGGIIAFALKDSTRRAVRFAIEVQTSIPVFNLISALDSHADVALRIGIDSGKVRFNGDTGKIVSDVINYAAHLEKKSTEPGCISLSRAVYDTLPKRLATLFHFEGIFEDKDFFTTLRRLDGLLLDDGSKERFA